MGIFLKEALWAARALARRPGFTLVAVITLGIGIGANTALFTVLNAALLRPLPYEEPDRLVRIFESNLKRGWPQFSMSHPNFQDLRAQNRSLSSMAAWQNRSFSVTGSGDPEQIGGGAVTPELFRLLGSQPALGRGFTQEEAAAGAGPRAVMMTHGLWQRRFGGDPAILGRRLRLDGAEHTIVGVMPAELSWYSGADLFIPLDLSADPRRGNHTLAAFGRLKPGVTREQAQEELGAIAGRLAGQYPDTNTGWSVALIGFDEWIVGAPFERSLWILMAAVACVLLIACGNVANLLLARATGRRREIALRAALGAGRLRLIGQQLMESLLVAGVGGGLGLLVAVWGVDLLRSADPGSLPRANEISIDASVLAYALGITLLTALLSGLLPALQASRADLAGSLRQEGRGASGSGPAGSGRLRSGLVALEFALCLVLLVGAGLLMRSFLSLGRIDPGFRTDRLMTFRLNLPGGRYGDPERLAAFYQPLLESVRSLPEVEAAAGVSIIPFSGGNTSVEVEIEGRVPDPDGSQPSADWRIVSPGYFHAMGIPLLAGRDLEDRDLAGNPYVAVVSQTMAKRYWPGADPIGKRVRAGESGGNWHTVVAVAGDVRGLSLETEPRPQMYLCAWQNTWPIALVVRTKNDEAGLLAAVRGVVSRLDSEVPVHSARTMEEILDGSLGARRFPMILLAVFAAVALLLASLGLYGVTSYAVAQRRHEMGIRIALGARPADVMRLIVGQGARLVAAGLAVGLACAAMLTRLMSSLLFGITPTDPLTFAGVAALLAVVALAAAWLPARRATRVDPMIALRYE